MDQTACAVGKVITIDFKEVGHPVVRKVPFDLAAKGFALCISDTKGSHADLTDDYAAVRREMESVAEFFGKKVLRDVDEETFLKAIPEVRKVTGDRAWCVPSIFIMTAAAPGKSMKPSRQMILTASCS